MFVQLIENLNVLRERTARFRRVALHLHSVSSFDWGRGASDRVRNDRSRFSGDGGLQEFAGELKPHLDLVCVTDHMRCDFGTQLSAKVGPNDEFMVLPGMEINFRLEPPLGFARIHLLVILPEGSTKEAFARLFSGQPKIPDDRERTGQEEVTGLSLSDWVKRVHAEQGLCVAAHVENNQGIRYRFRQVARETLRLISEGDGSKTEEETGIPQNLKEYLLLSGLNAVEIHRTKDAQHYRWISNVDGKTRWIATTLTFDSHNVEEFAKPDRVTHIKMTRLGLKGLKEALLFPDTRIRFPDNLPTPPSPRLLGIWISGEESSFFDDVTIAFAENLNCLIGVRGSGKSTVVEALRYVFGYNRTLPTLGKLKDTILEMQKANLTGCLIRVVYRTSAGDERVLTATFDEKSNYSTKVYSTDGDVVQVANVEDSGDYPLRLFGWSEIETLGREHEKQRDLLDLLVPALKPSLREREFLREQLRTNRGALAQCIEEVRVAFDQNDNEIRRFKEYKADFEKLNTKEVKELFSALDLAQEKRRLLVQMQSNCEKLIGKLSDPTGVSLQSDLQTFLDKGSQELRDWWYQVELERLGLISTEQEAIKLVLEAVTRLKSYGEIILDHIKGIDGEVEKIQKGLREKFAADSTMEKIAELRANAGRRLERASTLRDEYQKKWKALKEAMDLRERIADELAKMQNQIAGIRSRYNAEVEETLNRFLPDRMKVSIGFEAGGDTAIFADGLYKIFGAKGNQPKRIRSLVERFCTPISFAKMLREGNVGELVGRSGIFEGVELTFTDNDAAVCLERTRPFEQDEFAEVDVLVENGARLDKILDLHETIWDDHEAILLNGKPINEKSPGQRSSALLPLIALAETTPLIIDQPEDNLDKRLIGTVLMKVLSVLKERRQIIVCTHDPNILVGGDAEQVVVLEAESDRRGKVAQHGSIDNDDIVDTVVDLLEGGAEAFEARQKRYHGRVGL